MDYRRLGSSGLKVSEICLGTMTFGNGTAYPQVQEMVSMCLDSGINFFDCANSYAGGESEVMLGKALAGRRGEAIVITKVFNPMGQGINDSGMSRVHIMQSIEDSLRRLGMDYVDIFCAHHVDIETPLEEMLRAFDDLVRQGKTRYIACSNYQAWRLATALGISDKHNWTRFTCYQSQYSLVVRDIEQELIPLCQYHGLGVVVWAPLAGGYLSGKYRPGQLELQGTRSAQGFAFPVEFFHAEAPAILSTLLEVAGTLGRSPAQVAIRWILEQPAITSAIVGARTVEQLSDNLGAAGWRLDGEALERLNTVSYLPERYPESMEKTMKARRVNAVRRI